MCIRIQSIATLSLLLLTLQRVYADAGATHHLTQHIFHAFWLDFEHGGGKQGSVTYWDIDGWIGGDDNKLWLKSEGELKKSKTEKIELWGMYSRNISSFWDLQMGIRHDTQPHSTSYGVVGFNGLAPYFLDTEAHLFISEHGDISARLKQSTHLLITQCLGLEPYYKVNLFAQGVPKLNVGKGLSSWQVGLQIRYEISREVAPYVNVEFERKFGKTLSIATRHKQDKDVRSCTIGIRLML